MLTQTVIQACPHSKTALGKMYITHDILGELAGNADYDYEWLALLYGTWESGIVRVTGYSIPKEAQFSSAHVSLGSIDMDPSIVGVVHLHPSGIPAKFSHTDNTQLNTRFASSLVIGLGQKEEDERLLGFAYEAVGPYTLPCGNAGRIQYKIVPEPIVEQWPSHPLKTTIVKPNVSSLGDCIYTRDTHVGMKTQQTALCGLYTITKREAIFGRAKDTLAAAIQKHGHTTFPLDDKRPWGVKDNTQKLWSVRNQQLLPHYHNIDAYDWLD